MTINPYWSLSLEQIQAVSFMRSSTTWSSRCLFTAAHKTFFVPQFRAVMDSLYQSFEQAVATSNFAEISGSVISWVEEHCKPQVS